MARPARIPTQDELNAIVEMKSKGMSDEKVAKALSCSRSTLATWKKDAVGRQKAGSVNTQVAQAVKMGYDQRRERHLALAVDAVDELLSTYEYEETTVITKMSITGEMYDEVKKVKKKIRPNPMMTIFTLVNRDSENFRSINHPVEKDDDDEMPDGVELEFDE